MVSMKDKLRHLYLEQKKSTWEIARIYEVSQTTIRRWLKEEKIKARSYKENKMPVAKGSHLKEVHREAISRGLKSSERFKKWRTTQVGENHPNWTPLIEKICDYCGKSVKRKS